MRLIIAYVTILIVFGLIDAVWLSVMASALYYPLLGDMMVDSIRLAPAVVFYLFYPVGIVVFAVRPALRETSVMSAALLGGLYGALCYATYDLTNYATLKNWSLQVTVIDILYGALTACTCAVAAYLSANWYQRR